MLLSPEEARRGARRRETSGYIILGFRVQGFRVEEGLIKTASTTVMTSQCRRSARRKILYRSECHREGPTPIDRGHSTSSRNPSTITEYQRGFSCSTDSRPIPKANKTSSPCVVVVDMLAARAEQDPAFSPQQGEGFQLFSIG